MIILKGILITLLVLLGLILALLAMVLLIPLRYQVTIRITEDKEIEADGFVKYFLSAIKFTFSYYKEELDTALYILGFRKKKENALEEEVYEDVTEDVTEDVEIIVETDIKNEASETTEECKSSQEETTSVLEDVQIEEQPAKKKVSFSKEKFLYWKNFVTDEHNQSVVKKIFRELRYLLRHFKFRKIETDLIYGAGEPALTGQILGVLSMIPVLYHYEVQIVPDFESEEPYIHGTALFAGKVRLIHLLIAIIRLLLDKEVRIVIKRFMRKAE